MALIRIGGGQLPKEQVITQLQRLYPGKWKWELEENEDNTFITKFPSKAELQRAIAFGGADVREEGVQTGQRLQFEAWHEKEEGFLLPKVWVRVFGLRKNLREYMNLWAVGSMLGSTQTVDMEVTRENVFGRVCVAVLNPLLIPSHLDVVIGDHYFELDFEVEKLGTDENGEEAIFDWKGDAAGEGEGEDSEEDHMQDDPEINRETKRRKNNTDYKGKENSSTDNIQADQDREQKNSLKERVQNMNDNEFLLFLKEKAGEIIDKAVDKTLDNLADQVMNERDEGQDSENSWEEEEGRDELQKVAAIPEVIITPTRASPRLAQSGDEHILSKTEKMAARKNLEHNEAIHNVEQLGIRVGDSRQEMEKMIKDLFILESRVKNQNDQRCQEENTLGVVILHETIHELCRKKQDGIILKLDFEKAYDKVNWTFLQQALKMKGFSPTWCKWIENIVSGGSVGVKVNDDIGHFFQTKQGLRQGDPLSPVLFNVVADMLAVLIARAKEKAQIKGLVPHLVDGVLSILQYADDTILFMENNIEQAKNLKLVLSTFEKLSGLKINFHKSELYCFGEAKNIVKEYVEIFGCKEGIMPFKYLGIPMYHRRLTNKDWKMVEERFQKKLASWKSKLLSVGGRLVLINSVLSSLPMFMMSFFRIPKGVLKRLDYYRSRFFWQCDEYKKKYRLAKWSILCVPKSVGGLGISNLEVQNRCLLSKWLFKLLNEEGVWQKLLRRKYLSNKTLTQVKKKKGDSQFWGGLMEIKDQFMAMGRFEVHNGKKTRFWEDVWIVFRGTYWARAWAMLSKEEEKIDLKKNCSRLEITALDFFHKYGWNFRRRLMS
ncbi:uncharacterized protein LOC111257326 [Setaria italica]|uniref:uncharacterized protein LOC111257326 n=1 Tax=Setaria italica TaxID=4555 RepID=UPI000BE5CEC1|nr:uncharacterized protein LOC111257326 [Setaria italica]